ncbi:MAG: YaeF family permuted papain-like enzyme, partial [Hydrogenophaga sp.]
MASNSQPTARGFFMGRASVLWVALVALSLSGCATRFLDPTGQKPPSLQVQNRLLLTPANGGKSIQASDLRAGDIVLSATNGLASLGIRLLTVTPVSHAALYLGNGQMAEAVGSGVQIRSTADFIAGESTIVAFRHPDLSPEQAATVRAFAQAQEGKKYNALGIVLQAPFVLQRQFCEIPLVPSLVRDACIRGLAAIQLGAARNDRFFCSQFVLEAYQRAKLPLTTANPLLVSPADLLHMREGDVPSVRTEQALQYVGHLKSGPVATDTK